MLKPSAYYRINWRLGPNKTITYFAYGWIGTDDFVAEKYMPILMRENGKITVHRKKGIFTAGYFPKKQCTFRKLKNNPFESA